MPDLSSTATRTQQIAFIDTHTGGEPTRIIWELPEVLQGRTLPEKLHDFRQRFDHYRRAIVCEPRGSDVMVGALVTDPIQDGSTAGVIFFNNVGYLGMCGHGSIGVAVALQHAQRIGTGRLRLDTPVGTVELELHDQHHVSVHNVPSYRYLKQVEVVLDDQLSVHGDVAWGGNWFFICEDHELDVHLDNVQALTDRAWQIRHRLKELNITGENGAEIDHIELLGAPSDPRHADGKNFVLCPGGAYDRSPCGTGTSAKIACLAADNALAPGQVYRQESIVGSRFDVSYSRLDNQQIQPVIRGSAFVNAEGRIILDPQDLFGLGIG
ncbi:MAG: proline racemase family protein [bacterium]|nr:proline racemase family protein [bacterium]